jgi:hypothetical protein
MAVFHLVLRAGLDMVGRQAFEAEDSISALFVAAAIVDGCAEDCDSYELWENAYRIDAPVSLSSRELTRQRQEHVIAAEESILSGRWTIARSKHLLARLSALKAANR